jgi:RNA polymerase sigma-70 factor (ECF subfamily)
VTNSAARPQYPDVDESDRPAAPALAQFDAVYNEHLDYVWRTLGRLGVLPRDLEDSAHEVFIVVYKRWADLDPARPIRPWLFGVARRVAAAYRRKPRAELGAGPEGSTRDDERLVRRDFLWRALSELSDERLEIIVLHDLEGKTGKEIATLLGIPANTVHSRLRLARTDLTAIVRRLDSAR